MSPKKEFLPYLLLFAGVFCLFSLLSFQENDWEGSLNWFGKLGFYFSFGIFFLLGKSGYLIAIALLVLGGLLFRDRELDLLGKLLLLPILILSVSLALGFLTDDLGHTGDAGGVVGIGLGKVLDFTIGSTGKAILTAFLFTYSLFVILKDENLSTTKQKLFERWANLNNFIKQKENWSIPQNLFELRKFFQTQTLAQESVGTGSGYGLGKNNFDFPMPKTKVQKPFERSQTQSLWNSLSKSDTKNGFRNSTDPSEITQPIQIKDEGSPPKQKNLKSFPRYKNTHHYPGSFEEENIYKFQSVSQDLKRKLSDTKDSMSYGFTILDYRSNPDISKNSNINWDEKETDSVQSLRPLDWSQFTEGEKKWDQEDFDENDSSISLIKNTSVEDLSILNELDSAENGFPSLDSAFLNPEMDDDEMLDPIVENESIIENSIVENPIQPTTKKVTLAEPTPKSYVPQVKLKKGYYISPKLLGGIKPKIHAQASQADSDAVARKIEEIISHYGIQSKVVTMERGPIITRYELTIPNGVKLSKITSLADELKYYLAVKNIRIVAPIPGKSTIGVEVPNINREDVHLTELLRESTLAKAQGGLSICIGKDISGKSMNIDLTKLPHLLVAGTTGSGKSVCLNSMITSLIFTRSPQELRFIMIDPKMVEMTLYEDIPHLLMPVITDPKKATRALAWAIQEMEARYHSVSSLKCRDFQSYNQKVEDWAHSKGFVKMPYIVIFIDELSDLMMVSGRDLEEQITRISQKSRAVGIHLVMATQRPSVDVITGLIKANCPARMAFQVAQKTDSRTILDANGAESLLGKGDFLYRSPTASDLVRVQAPYVSESEIETIVEEAKKLGSPNFAEVNLDEEPTESTDTFEEDEKLIEDSWRVISREGKASGSLLQRHLRIGYNKAARVIEILEKRGIITPQIGTKPREILKQL
jgi:S-DNA-T family DNA segregation ATPase FtsK/SpoIIIE